MSQSSPADEGTTFEHLWSTLEPDSTYFELPPGGHSGDSEASSGLPTNRAEVCMDIFHMRDMNETVMGVWRSGIKREGNTLIRDQAKPAI
ncbi:hypothetical protein AGOR_G00134780 [Albula goreensis]|uniref:Uncharacterized protein n=1 Tax=Albula goreensis TaxID=1534307 RepID=A0A8T3D9Y6_9TELE|nr:hypothetical protein AGOR_G00134780 [Albula goreensis]